MVILNEQQKQRAIEAMQQYLSAPEESEMRPSTEVKRRSFPLDHERARVIEEELKPLIKTFLLSDLGLQEFKSKIDSINKRNRYWGFNLEDVDLELKQRLKMKVTSVQKYKGIEIFKYKTELMIP